MSFQGSPDLRIMVVKSLSDLWAELCLDASNRAGEFELMFRYVQRVLAKHLGEQGFETPAWANADAELTMGLDPLPLTGGRRPGRGVAFTHLVNMVWQPVLRHMEGSCPWTARVAKNHEALVVEMNGIGGNPSEPLLVDDWVSFIHHTIARLVGVDVPVDLITAVAVPLTICNWAPTTATARHFMRTSLAGKLVGPTMAKQLSRKVLAEVADVPAPLMSDADLLKGCQRDLVASLRLQHCEDDVVDIDRPTKRLRRAKASMSQTLAASTQTVLYALKHHVGSAAVRGTVTDAVELVKNLAGVDVDCDMSGGGATVSYTAFARHLLVLDGAIGRWMAEELFCNRENGTFAGVALATDESPPSQPRFRGLRFQITVLYV